MNKIWKFLQCTTVAAVFTSLSFTALSDELIEEIIVTEGPVALHHDGWTTGGLPVHVLELTRRVSYADLDLSREDDVAVFRQRIETAAKLSCEELADAYPVDFWGRKAVPECIKEAVNRSEKQVLAAITAQRAEQVAAR